jgi:hypothetical protein
MAKRYQRIGPLGITMDYVKLVALLMQLPDAVKREVALGVANATNASQAAVQKLVDDLPGMIDSAVSAKVDPLKSDVEGLDAQVKAALDKLAADGVDLSKFEDEIAKLGNGKPLDASDTGADLSTISKGLGDLGTMATGNDSIGGASSSSTFNDFSKHADETAGSGSGSDQSTTAKDDDGRATLDKPAGLDSALKPLDPGPPVNSGEMQPTTGVVPAASTGTMAGAFDASGAMGALNPVVEQSPADAGKEAAEKAKAAGQDEIAAAAKAAYARAVDLAKSPSEAFSAANDAALAAGAGIPEAARAATNASA